MEQSRKYILERGSRLQDAINRCTDPVITEALIQTTENHYSNAEQYLDQGSNIINILIILNSLGF